jgi:Tfp pilus assembly PilM family ATPase
VFSSPGNGWIGIDLGCNTVKVAQVRKRRAGYVFEKAVVLRRETPWLVSGWRSDCELSSQFELRTAQQLVQGFDGSRAASVLPMRCYDLQDMQLTESHESTLSLVEQHVASLYENINDEYEYDYWESPDQTRDGSVDANSIAVVTKRTMQIAEDCRHARLQLQAVDGYPTVIARAITMMGNSPAGPIAAIDFGRTEATFCVTQHGQPAFVRTMRECGLEKWIDVVQTGLGLTGDEAESLLYRHGLPSNDGRPMDEITAAVLDCVLEPLHEFQTEIQRTLSYLASHRRSVSPTSLVLLGGGASIKGLVEHLSGQLSLSCSPWNLNGVSSVTTRDVAMPASLFAMAAATSALAWQEIAL